MNVWELLAIPGYGRMSMQQKAALYLDAKQRQEEAEQEEAKLKRLERRISSLEAAQEGAKAS